MAKDDLTKRKIDKLFVNLTQDYEIDQWTKHFKMSEDELRNAVEKHGNVVAQLELIYL